MSAYVDEYRRELQKAVLEQDDRSTSVAIRLGEVEEQISNLRETARSARRDGFASQILNEDLEALGAQREKLRREAARVAPFDTMPASAEAVIERLHAVLSDLTDALKGTERDAARARDIIRSLIKQIVIMPFDDEGKRDGRGAGPVRVTVEGPLQELLGLANVDWEIKGRKGEITGLDLSTVTFKYYVDVIWENTSYHACTYADVAVFSQLLDDADAPVTRKQLEQSLAKDLGEDRLQNRAIDAIAYLSTRDRIRVVRQGKKPRGWVWSDRQIDDEEWARRANEATPNLMPKMRVLAPEAFVVVIGSQDEGEV